ncbi:MAG TPA: M28 family peptidase [Pyrinomonadaceae bacterium]
MLKSKPRTRAFRRPLSALLAAALLAGPALARQQSAAAAASAALTEAERAAVSAIKVETLREVTAALSADDMQGRGTGQPGGEKASQYIAERFRRIGLKPLGDKGSYFQQLKFREIEIAPDSYFKADDAALKMGDDYAPTPPYSGDEDLSGRVVFVGYGVQNQTHNDLRNLDVRGKVVVLIEGPPKGVAEAQWKKLKAPFEIRKGLITQGAAALVATNAGDEQTPYPMLADYLTRRQLEPADARQWPAELPPFIALSDAGAEKLFAGSGTTYAQARAAADRGEIVSRELKTTAKIKIKFKSAKVAAGNVVGYLEGSDPALKSEAVVYTAHYDAWGLGADGRLFHGAADNALGVAEMISVAESMLAAKERPRRSVIFLALTGEEYGGYGGDYWVKKPTWDIKKVAADFNFDGVGTEIYGPLKKIVGFGAEHSDLGATLQAVAAASNDAIIPDPMPEEKSFYRSDHYAFVKKGVPALMLMGAPDITTEALVARIKDYEKRAYHLPADVIQPDWNWEGPRGLAQVGLLVGLRVANADAMPAWLTSSPFNRKRGTDDDPPPEP